MAALVAVIAVGPGLAALGSLDVDEPRRKIKETAKASKKKKKTEDPPPAADAPVWTAGAVTASIAAVPIPVLGPFVAFATIAATPVFSGLSGALVALAASCGWGALGWAIGRKHARQPAPPANLAVILALVAAIAAPVIGLLMKPWITGHREGSMVAVLLGLVPAAVAVALYSRARTRQLEEPEARPAIEASWMNGLRRGVVALDTVASLPLSWADSVFAPRVPPKPSVEEEPS